MKNQKGFNMINLLLYMAGSAILLGGTIALWNDWQIENTGDEALKLITLVQPKLSKFDEVEKNDWGRATITDLNVAAEYEISGEDGILFLKNNIQVFGFYDKSENQFFLGFVNVSDRSCVNISKKLFDVVEGMIVGSEAVFKPGSQRPPITKISGDIAAQCIQGLSNRIGVWI